jgi:Flp pilus assembly CpaE family ATPase
MGVWSSQATKSPSAERPIGLLVVEHDPADARLLRRLLEGALAPGFDVEWAEQLSAALERLARPGLDAVLLDPDLPDSQGLETFTKVRAQAPELPIVLLGRVRDEELLLRAIGLGAQDLLMKEDLSAASMARVIRCAIERRRAAPEGRPDKAGRVLSFVGAKGGVGATTTALNVAAILARGKAEVIAVELTPWHGTFALQLGQTPPRNLSSLLDLEPWRLTAQELTSRLVTLACGAQVLFGPQKPEEFAPIQAGQAEALVRAAAQQADYVVVDLPCHPFPGAEAAVGHSDCVCLVIDRETTSVGSARIAIGLLKSWADEETVLGAVLVNRTPVISAWSLADIRSQVGLEILGVIPHDAEMCAAACTLGIPLAVSHPENAAAQSLAALANRLARASSTMAAVPL